MTTLDIYADGGSRNNGKPNAVGGWGWVMVVDDRNINEGYLSEPHLKTNNQNEIYSIANSLSHINKLPYRIDIYMDSAYVVNSMNDKWYEGWRKNNWKNSKKEPVKNRELWEELIYHVERLREEQGIKVTFNKVKGHSDNKWNEYADSLVNKAMDDFVKSNQ